MLSEDSGRGPRAPIILSMDIGTSSVRTVPFDDGRRPIHEAAAWRPMRINTPDPGAAELDADLVVESISKCIDITLARLDEAGKSIAAVACCAIASSLVGLDRNLVPITPLYTYADTRATGEADRLKAELDEPAVHGRTGCRFHSSYLPAQLRWLRRSEPDLFERVERWASIGEYLELVFFGEAAISYSAASWTGLLDWRRLIWDGELLGHLGLSRDGLSGLVDVSAGRTGLKPEYARRWPVLDGPPWFPAIGDGAAANIGSGCLGPDRVALTVGTSSAVRVVFDDEDDRGFQTPPLALWRYRVDARRSLVGGALNEGGCVFDWLKGLLNLPAPETLEASLAAREPDGHGLTVLPFLTGERAPGWAGDARAIIQGLSWKTEPIDVLRAAMEAVALRLAVVYGDLSDFLGHTPEVVASGGALSASAVWRRIVADALGRPLYTMDVREPSARGAALLARQNLGPPLDDPDDSVGLTIACEPDPARHRRYRAAGERQRKLYGQLIQGV